MVPCGAKAENVMSSGPQFAIGMALQKWVSHGGLLFGTFRPSRISPRRAGQGLRLEGYLAGTQIPFSQTITIRSSVLSHKMADKSGHISRRSYRNSRPSLAVSHWKTYAPLPDWSNSITKNIGFPLVDLARLSLNEL